MHPYCFWACTRLSDSLVQFGGLKPQFVSEFAKARHFQNFSLVSCNMIRTLCCFQYSFWLVKPIEWIILLNILVSKIAFSDINWKKHCTFQQLIWSSALRIAFNFLRKWLFCSLELAYQMFLCRSSTALSAWFCKARNFQNFPRFIVVTFNCSRLAFGISRGITRIFWFSSDFSRFAVFGLAHKHLSKFGVVKATFWCELVKKRLFQKVFWFEAL